MKNELVVKSNALINASYSLGLVEQRLILLAVVVLREHTHNNELDYIAFNRPIKISAESYISTFGVSHSTAYETLKDACKTLFARQFSYKEPRERGVAHKTTRWVSDIAYVDNSATVEFTFAPAVLPLITFLGEHLTSYEVQQVAGVTSGYAIRLYELLIAWRSTGKTPVFELPQFRARMGVMDGEYQRMGQLKEKVLHNAIAQINKHTDIIVDYEQHKKGRTITGFSFSFKPKKAKEVKQIERDPKTVDWINEVADSDLKGMSPSQAILFAEKLHRNPAIVGEWQGGYDDAKNKLIKQLQEPQYIREYMQYLLACEPPFEPKTLGFKP